MRSPRCGSDSASIKTLLLDHASELTNFGSLVLRLAEHAPVFAVGGNHDQHIGLDDVRDVITNNGGCWIHDRHVSFAHGVREITVAGPLHTDKVHGDVWILCAHNPRIWKSSKDSEYDIVLAGHLHGCQAVAFEYRHRLCTLERTP